jgi:multidrug efflux pump subunit AcrA (membrane-fusion protein)
MKQKTILKKAGNAVFVFALLFGILVCGCRKTNEEPENAANEEARPKLSENGKTIIFPVQSEGLRQIQTITTKKETGYVAVFAPARVVATIAASSAGNGKIIIFDSPDVTSLYSSYKQSKANAERTDKNLKRTQEMFENQGATLRDVTEAENDAANARTTLDEMEAKLRGLGYNPKELESVSPNSVLLMCDVIEAQLRDVQKGEDVDIIFSSYPDKKFNGRATSLGDAIDPVTRSIKVRVTMPNPGFKFVPGMFAKVDFGDPVPSVVLLPLSAVVTVDGKDYAFVETSPGAFERREIVTASSNASNVIVLKGISESEKVVSSGAMLLKGLSFGF